MQKILIFLFINEKCYGAQLQRQFKTSLTPIQKALLRLEGGKLVKSYFEGKNRMYRFNPDFPLLVELEALLKKAYTLLSAQEKKDYYVITHDFISSEEKPESNVQTLVKFWEILSSVNQLTFCAKSRTKNLHGWNGRGKGEVSVTKKGDNILIFNERGFWYNEQNNSISFKNVFRWTLDKITGVISLEHLRKGEDRPVFLFHLAPSAKYSLSSIDSHFCDGDVYLGRIFFNQYSLRLNWRIIGPKKNEEIDYQYFYQEGSKDKIY